MPINITMPALSPTMEEGTLAKWLVKEGDEVSSGDLIAEIETDKATMEVEAVEEGVVAKLLVAEGTEGVAVNAVIAVLAEAGEDVGSVSKPRRSLQRRPQLSRSQNRSQNLPRQNQFLRPQRMLHPHRCQDRA